MQRQGKSAALLPKIPGTPHTSAASGLPRGPGAPPGMSKAPGWGGRAANFATAASAAMQRAMPKRAASADRQVRQDVEHATEDLTSAQSAPSSVAAAAVVAAEKAASRVDEPMPCSWPAPAGAAATNPAPEAGVASVDSATPSATAVALPGAVMEEQEAPWSPPRSPLRWPQGQPEVLGGHALPQPATHREPPRTPPRSSSSRRRPPLRPQDDGCRPRSPTLTADRPPSASPGPDAGSRTPATDGTVPTPTPASGSVGSPKANLSALAMEKTKEAVLRSFLEERDGGLTPTSAAVAAIRRCRSVPARKA